MKIASEKEMLQFGQEFAKKHILSKSPLIIELIGDVGSGKTTFTRGFAAGLNINNEITSPSFNISKSYALKNGGYLIHYDFYRLKDPGIMLDDLKENLQNPKNIIIVEWGESVENLLPKNRIKINIAYNDDNSREVTL